MENKNELTPKEKREKLCDYILSKENGITVKYDELNEIIQEDLKDIYGRIRFKTLMNKVKNDLYEYGCVIRSIYNQGYYILNENQISSYTYRNFIVKPTKQFNKAKMILEKTNKKKLTQKENDELDLTKELNEIMIDNAERAINSNNFKSLKGEKNE